MQKYHKQKYNSFYMDIARIAAGNSVANRKKVGACIVLPNGLISVGWNGTASGTENHCETEDGLTKLTVIHAEINALKKLLVAGVSVKDAKVFCTLSPCLACAVQLVDLGLSEFIYLEEYKDLTGVEILRGSNIKVSKL